MGRAVRRTSPVPCAAGWPTLRRGRCRHARPGCCPGWSSVTRPRWTRCSPPSSGGPGWPTSPRSPARTWRSSWRWCCGRCVPAVPTAGCRRRWPRWRSWASWCWPGRAPACCGPRRWARWGCSRWPRAGRGPRCPPWPRRCWCCCWSSRRWPPTRASRSRWPRRRASCCWHRAGPGRCAAGVSCGRSPTRWRSVRPPGWSPLRSWRRCPARSAWSPCRPTSWPRPRSPRRRCSGCWPRWSHPSRPARPMRSPGWPAGRCGGWCWWPSGPRPCPTGRPAGRPVRAGQRCWLSCSPWRPGGCGGGRDCGRWSWRRWSACCWSAGRCATSPAAGHSRTPWWSPATSARGTRSCCRPHRARRCWSTPDPTSFWSTAAWTGWGCTGCRWSCSRTWTPTTWAGWPARCPTARWARWSPARSPRPTNGRRWWRS